MDNPKRFAITGVAGYIAPRHLSAIETMKGVIVAALDPHDSVGILDRYGYEIQFFQEPERFDRHLEKLAMLGDKFKIDYLSVCSPNYLHESHTRMGLRVGADVICEKPLVINPENLDLLEKEEDRSGHKVHPILQMRYQPRIVDFIQHLKYDHRYQVTISYITARGNWYMHSWKNDWEKSGGLIFNIGVHLFDLLIHMFGDATQINSVHCNNSRAWGELILENADVTWNLSIDPIDAPKSGANRLFVIDDIPLDFTEYAQSLHSLSYNEILAGRGWGIKDARPAIELAHRLSR